MIIYSPPLSLPSMISTIISLLCLFAAYLVYKVVVRPLVRMQFYRKQGIPCMYFPLLGDIKLDFQALKTHDDVEYVRKTGARNNPQRIACSNFGFDAIVTINDITLVKEFYLNTENYIKDPPYLQLYSSILGKGLITSEGSQWKTQRKILSNSFHFQFLKSILPQIQELAHRNLYSIRNSSLKDVNVMNEFQNITGEVIGRVFFGEQLDNYTIEGKKLTNALEDIMIQIARLTISVDRLLLGAGLIQKGIFPKHRKLMNGIKCFRNVCQTIIEERKKLYAGDKEKVKSKTKDMLDLLLESPSEEGKLSDEEIIDQFVTFFLAGMDTTGHLIAVCIYMLHKYPEYRAKMVEEMKQFYNPKDTITVENLNKLEFTTAFLKETLRTITPVPGIFPRRAIKEHKLKEFTIREGDLVSLYFYYNHFNPEHFEDPDRFDPNRWIGKDKASEGYTYIPFSAGPRNCIGQHLAMFESRIILSEFLMMYDFTLKDNYKLKMGVKFLYEPVDYILVNVNPKYN